LTFDFLQFIIMLQHIMFMLCDKVTMKVFIKKIITQDLCFCSSAADVIIFLLYDAAPYTRGMKNTVSSWSINQCIPFHVLYCVFMYMPAFIHFILLYCQKMMKWSLF